MLKVNRLMRVLMLVALLAPAVAFAATAKKYQVTGKVLAVTDTMITVEKDDEKWEINRDPNTKVEGDLKVGSKVTIHYRMIANDVEVKTDTK